MTLATVVYYSGYHPYTMNQVKTAISTDEKTKQRKFFFWYKEENKNFIRNYLSKVKRFDISKSLYN